MPTELNLKRQQIECLQVTIEDKTYKIPLGNSLKRKELMKLKTEEGQIEFLEKYLTKKLMDDLTQGEINTIVEAWAKATQEASGMKLGES